ncbi:MAG: DNA repair exonuclease [Gammaproteobacteria bacterium]|nr:DNA repair exonuclease [Gammaproteobacteria bacterium]MYD75124.1 DNA repair exonuclease [Gammaproteobacteria bacterium]
MNPAISILAIGDMHLGTLPSGLPDEIDSSRISRHDLSPAVAFDIAVTLAIDKGVDTVLLAGDVVESANARFEAMVPLEKGIRRLIDNSIRVIAVAGNHDVDALPRLTALIDGFCLLGADGQWETTVISKEEIPVAEIVGWSFPERHVRESPVAKLQLEPASASVCRIGLLHADLDASGGPYAPVRRAELLDQNFDAWLLGHIHKPSLRAMTGHSSDRPVGYLGSLVGLDPTETGPHGPWLLEISAEGIETVKQVPIAPLRWENIRISTEGLRDPDDLSDRLLDQAARLALKLAKDGPPPRVLGLRATLTGRCDGYRTIRKWVEDGEYRRVQRMAGSTWIFFNKIVNLADAPIDIRTIASGDDPAALLARQILVLMDDGPEAGELVERARDELKEAVEESVWAPVDDHRSAMPALSDASLRELLVRSGKTALDAMLEQNPRDEA